MKKKYQYNRETYNIMADQSILITSYLSLELVTLICMYESI